MMIVDTISSSNAAFSPMGVVNKPSCATTTTTATATTVTHVHVGLGGVLKSDEFTCRTELDLSEDEFSTLGSSVNDLQNETEQQQQQHLEAQFSIVEQQEDEESASSSSSSPPTSTTKIRFSDVQIREYAQTLGDNPSVSSGTPIQLDWRYVEYDDMDLETYEAHRESSRRPLRHMVLDSMDRRNTLKYDYGHSDSQIRNQATLCRKIRKQRQTTVKQLKLQPFEAAFESASRKAKKVLSLRLR